MNKTLNFAAVAVLSFAASAAMIATPAAAAPLTTGAVTTAGCELAGPAMAVERNACLAVVAENEAIANCERVAGSPAMKDERDACILVAKERFTK